RRSLSLHDALPISDRVHGGASRRRSARSQGAQRGSHDPALLPDLPLASLLAVPDAGARHGVSPLAPVRRALHDPLVSRRGARRRRAERLLLADPAERVRAGRGAGHPLLHVRGGHGSVPPLSPGGLADHVLPGGPDHPLRRRELRERAGAVLDRDAAREPAVLEEAPRNGVDDRALPAADRLPLAPRAGLRDAAAARPAGRVPPRSRQAAHEPPDARRAAPPLHAPAADRARAEALMSEPVRVLYSFPHKLGAGRICHTAWQQVNGLAAADRKSVV